jgi:hypothetical protein
MTPAAIVSSTAPMPFFVKPIAKGIVSKVRNGYLDPNVQLNLDFMEASLSKSTWFCGEELTAANAIHRASSLQTINPGIQLDLLTTTVLLEPIFDRHPQCYSQDSPAGTLLARYFPTGRRMNYETDRTADGITGHGTTSAGT